MQGVCNQARRKTIGCSCMGLDAEVAESSDDDDKATGSGSDDNDDNDDNENNDNDDNDDNENNGNDDNDDNENNDNDNDDLLASHRPAAWAKSARMMAARNCKAHVRWRINTACNHSVVAHGTEHSCLQQDSSIGWLHGAIDNNRGFD